MFESGKIALSQAPSLLNSSARPCIQDFYGLQLQKSNYWAPSDASEQGGFGTKIASEDG